MIRFSEMDESSRGENCRWNAYTSSLLIGRSLRLTSRSLGVLKVFDTRVLRNPRIRATDGACSTIKLYLEGYGNMPRKIYRINYVDKISALWESLFTINYVLKR